MSLHAITCDSCGGAIALEIGESLPRCLFCGSAALSIMEALPEEIEPPHAVLPFEISDQEADAAFREFAQSSFWYPDDIRQARLELQRLMLPAWVWSGFIETHYTALVSASTQSGKRPVAGSEAVRLSNVLVPASTALTHAELVAIAPFEQHNTVAFDPETLDLPFELGSLTRTAATEEAIEAMESRQRKAIQKSLGAMNLKTSVLHSELDGRPVLFPIFIGAYRRGSNVFRVVINGQTGKLTGTAPLSWFKIALVVFGVLAVLAGIVGTFILVTAIASQF